MNKKETKTQLKDCANLLMYINTKTMPKVVKEQFETELQELCLKITRLTMDIYQRYNEK